MAKGLNVWVNIGGKLLPSLTQSTNAVPRLFSKMNRSLRIQAAETKAVFKEISGAMSPIVGMMAAGGLTLGLKGIFVEGAEYQHQISMMKNMGRSSLEVAGAVAAANRTMAQVPTSTLNESMAMLNHTTLAFGGLAHAMDNLSFNSKMGALMKGVMGDGFDEADGFNQLVRALELRSGKMNPKDYQRQANGLFKAMVVSGGTVNPEEFLGFMQQAGVAARGYSEGFLTRVAPSLIQEFGGQRAGTALTAMFNQFMGRVGVGGKSITDEWTRLGLAPKTGTGGNLSKNGWSPGSLKGNALAMSDPLAYVEQVIFPALRAHGVDTNNRSQMILQAQKMFGRETGKRVASTLFDPAQLARIHADQKLYDRASGVDKAYSSALYNDPKMAGMAAANSLKNLETTLGKAVTPQVTTGLQNMARAVNWLAGAFDRHPGFAKGVVGLMSIGAATATLKVFGMSMRWAFSPLTWVAKKGFKTLFSAVGEAGPKVPLAKKLGTSLMSGMKKLGPLLLRGVGLAFGFLTSPIGLALLAIAAVALIWHFRKQIASAFKSVVAWFKTSAWPAIKSTFSAAVDWGSTLIDNIIKGVSGQWSRLKGWFSQKWGELAPTWLGGGSTMRAAAPLAGKRAMGGPVLGGRAYLVGERGPEIFHAPMSGSIMTASRTDRLLRDMHGARRSVLPAMPRDRRGFGAGGGGVTIQGATVIIKECRDPHGTERAVERVLRKMAGGQAAYLSD
jgi:hypothetical protein